MESFFNMQTNKMLLSFVVDNIVLLGLIKYTLAYICKKTPFAYDDDLASFFGGAIDLVTKKKQT